MIPKDPVILLGFINMKLRDEYASLERLCEELELAEKEVVDKLSGIDYHYDVEQNQFK